MLSAAFLSILLAEASESSPAVATFLQTHCADCHADGGDEGGFKLESLGDLHADAATHERWVRVLDRVERGEMPPQDADQPTADDRVAFAAHLTPPLVAADQQRQQSDGRGRVRRLNRSEYETALSDLFAMPVRVADLLPEDARSHGFDTVGDALNLSSVQVAAYLEALDVVLDEATHLVPPPKQETFRLKMQEAHTFMQTYRRGGPFRVEADGVVLMARELFSHFNGDLPQYVVPHDGRYRIEIPAYTVDSAEPVVLTLRAGGTGHSESQHVPSVVLKHFVVAPGDADSAQMLTWEGELMRGHYLHLSPSSLRPMRFNNDIHKKLAYRGPGVLVRHVDITGPILPTGNDGQTVWPPASHDLLWGGVATAPLEDADKLPDPNKHLREPPGKVAEPRIRKRTAAEIAELRKQRNGVKNNLDRFYYDGPTEIRGRTIGGEPVYRAAPIPKEPLPRQYRLAPEQPYEEAARLLQRFVARAFRTNQPQASDEAIAPYLGLATRWLDEGATFEEAMRAAYQAVLCSPEFLYRRDSLPTSLTADGTLENDAIAERLAFFLWNGPPDARLLDADLSNPAVRRSEAERLLDDARSERFLTHLLDEWFDLRLIDFTTPDSLLYPEHDDLLQWSMLEETRGYVREMLAADRPAAELIDSDWAMLNWRLARHYGLEREAAAAGVNKLDGMTVRPVPLPADSVRGGVLTQASVLKVTANGTTTSPVVRGVWVLDRILGTPPPPPPPGVPAIEPDIRGAVTVREQIEQHRADTACAVCHAAIDPPGLALEAFDVIGGYRNRYRKLNEELADQQVRHGPKPDPVRFLDGLPVDASGVTSDGRAFDDIVAYKRLLLADRDAIARGVATKFVIYATGAAPSIADRAAIETLLDRTRDHEFGLRSLLLEVVASPLFSRK